MGDNRHLRLFIPTKDKHSFFLRQSHKIVIKRYLKRSEWDTTRPHKAMKGGVEWVRRKGVAIPKGGLMPIGRCRGKP